MSATSISPDFSLFGQPAPTIAPAGPAGRIFTVLMVLVVFMLTGASPAHGVVDASQTPASETTVAPSAFPKRPANVEAQTWSSLQNAVQQSKLLPRPCFHAQSVGHLL